MLTLLFTYVLGLDYILVPKNHHFFSVFVNVENFVEENNLDVLSMNSLVFLKKNTEIGLLKSYEDLFYIEQDVEITVPKVDLQLEMSDNHSQKVLTSESKDAWHRNRVVNRKSSDKAEFNLTKSGSCHTNDTFVTKTYIVDTGIDIKHHQFNGRAHWSQNFADDQDVDCQSHGTHVAGIVGSKDYGICVDAQLYAVKVLDCEGRGSLSNVIRGVDWVFKQHKSETNVKSIINMSLGGGFSRAMNRVVQYCLSNDDNFYIVVAAGNENNDACETSPASARSAFTVMASDKDDSRAWFSNWGDCANLYAPGVDIMSTVPNDRFASYSGTSMATPVIVGVFNHYVNMYPHMNMKKLKNKIIKDSSKDVIRSYMPGSNDLVFLQH